MMASYRYRAWIPSIELKKRGHETYINDGEVDVVVFSKPDLFDIEGAKNCKKAGLKVVVDICDDHLDNPQLGPVYRQVIESADVLVCPTKFMASRLAQFQKPLAVIPDPYEFAYRIPHARGEKFLWFGHQNNLPELQRWFPHLSGMDLTVVTGENTKVHHVRYTPDVLEARLADSNVCLLPTIPGHEYKSPNRLVNALRMGCFAVCEKHPSYEEFKKYVWVGNLYTGIRWAKAQESDLNGLVEEAQKHIEKVYSPSAVSDLWEEVLS